MKKKIIIGNKFLRFSNSKDNIETKNLAMKFPAKTNLIVEILYKFIYRKF